MGFVVYMLGQTHWNSPTSANPLPRNLNLDVKRTRLQKPGPIRDSSSFYSCKEVLNVIRIQSGSTLVSQYEFPMEAVNSQPRMKTLCKIQYSNSSSDSLSIYSSQEMDERTLKRTRAKTPVFAVGQLEASRCHPIDDATQALAEQYRAVLPPRAVTPVVELALPKRPRKTLRKIKRQKSLHHLMKLHSRAPSISDSETLVGSEASSPLSSSYSRADIENPAPLNLVDKNPVPAQEHEISDLTCSFDNHIALKICVDLLTNELATSLSRKHPLEKEDRASGLQILLMIEAYETVQQHIRQKMYHSRVMGENDDHVQVVERILEYWLEVLYSVYDRSHEKNHCVDVHSEPLED